MPCTDGAFLIRLENVEIDVKFVFADVLLTTVKHTKGGDCQIMSLPRLQHLECRVSDVFFCLVSNLPINKSIQQATV
ncbi:hypothetical protein ADK66_15080 [Micromonospora sp. NRRL B-16802]|nr:hypothetical protein ADK66_15080 [Micromonospora sp. NRRL B-16802]